MELITLGCSGSAPAPDAPPSGYLVRSGDTQVVVDLGNGTMGPLQRWANPFDPDALFLTHLHPDHCADVAPLTVYLRYHPDPTRDMKQRRLPVYAPPEAPSRLAALHAPTAAGGDTTDLSDIYDFLPPPVDGVRIGPLAITSLAAEADVLLSERRGSTRRRARRSTARSNSCAPTPATRSEQRAATSVMTSSAKPDPERQR
ncbi:MBL fold metallo-hydrolase [Actinokineospora sp. G85]|uniref:MBL fold metallo-hydrolase n=1 Tax=Actinokineospora sp. G85 TaxID=3406626 RepID=UPI003C722273